MQICHGWARKPIVLSLEQRYHPEQLMNRLGPFNKINQINKINQTNQINQNNPSRKLVSPLVWMPVWIYMDGCYIRLENKEEIALACKLVCVYHNGPDNRAPFCEEDSDWQDISEKEAFLAEMGVGEQGSSEEEEEVTEV